jgi:hypothetical protein
MPYYTRRTSLQKLLILIYWRGNSQLIVVTVKYTAIRTLIDIILLYIEENRKRA